LTGPKGQAGLNIRQWTCVHCLISHDRDVNAAINIRNRGLEWLQKECSIEVEAKACEASMNKDSQHQQSDVAAALGYGRPAEGIIVF
jgi:putative transposase